MSKKAFVAKEVEFHGELEEMSEPLSIHYVISEKLESKVEETSFPGEVEQPVLEKDQSERSKSESFVLTEEQLEQVLQIAPFLNRTILTEEDIKFILDFWQLNPNYNPFLHP